MICIELRSFVDIFFDLALIFQKLAVPLHSQFTAIIAQSVRVAVCGTVGHGFESH